MGPLHETIRLLVLNNIADNRYWPVILPDFYGHFNAAIMPRQEISLTGRHLHIRLYAYYSFLIFLCLFIDVKGCFSSEPCFLMGCF